MELISNFLIISHVPHKFVGGKYYAYAPYVREMNIWGKFTKKITIIAPLNRSGELDPIETSYAHPHCELVNVPELNLTTLGTLLESILLTPLVFVRILVEMNKADHIHLRCPGNMGLLGVFAQLFFPNKKKTAKYAGNWDPQSAQPFTYRLQRAILNNVMLTQNIKVLVYGNWIDSSSNILPFFTASYYKTDYVSVNKSPLREGEIVDLIFVGSLTPNKNPLRSAQILLALRNRGVNARMTFCGNGILKSDLQQFRLLHKMEEHMIIMGNVNAETLKGLYEKSHFLIFLSNSEGWPKAVAEAMFFGCVPITTPVSCVPEMLGYGERGSLVENVESSAIDSIVGYLDNTNKYWTSSHSAQKWSRNYTFEKFETEIENILVSCAR